jgi:hypothetical protein
MATMTNPAEHLPSTFTLPDLPVALDAWFQMVTALPDDSELLYDGSVLDGLGVGDAEAARQALIGYRFVWRNGQWADEAESGAWNPAWLVLDSLGADPIIADVSAPDVPVFTDAHGRGRWRPEPAHASLAEFLAAVEQVDDVPGPPPLDDPPSFHWQVWIEDLGPSPLQGLVRLKGWPLFPAMGQEDLLAVRDRLPYKVVDGLSEAGARSCVEFGAGVGIAMSAVDAPPAC